jgi:DNA-directed RNA polymerase specialized sigma24 family protein
MGQVNKLTHALSPKEAIEYSKRLWQWEQLKQDFIACFKNLCTEEEWAVLSCRHLLNRELSFREIAKRLNMSVDKAHKLYWRAIKKYGEWSKGGLHAWKKELDKGLGR